VGGCGRAQNGGPRVSRRHTDSCCQSSEENGLFAGPLKGQPPRLQRTIVCDGAQSECGPSVLLHHRLHLGRHPRLQLRCCRRQGGVVKGLDGRCSRTAGGHLLAGGRGGPCRYRWLGRRRRASSGGHRPLLPPLVAVPPSLLLLFLLLLPALVVPS
jgi:hypothetical protein